MSDTFFEPPPPPPEPPEAPATPEWIGPADNVLPGTFPLDALLVRTETTAIHLANGRAFANGFEFTLTMLRREPRTGRHDDPIMRWHEPLETIPDDVLRFGIELADGRKATVFDRFRHRAFEQEPPQPDAVLMQRGGGGGSHHWQIGFWVWPLPPAGPLAFVVEWPSESIALTRVEIDSEPIRAAATRAVELWPGPAGGAGSRVGGWTRQVSTMRRSK